MILLSVKVVLCLFHLILVCTETGSHKVFRRVCYFTNWSCDLLVPEAHFCLHDMDPNLCSHIIYGFVNINVTSHSLTPSRVDDESKANFVGRYVQFNDLKKSYPHLKTLLSVGGSKMYKDFNAMTATHASRMKFATNCIDYVRKWGFDGLDLDWEYPGQSGGSKEALTRLVQDLRKADNLLRQQSGLPPLLLSIAGPASDLLVDQGFEVDVISRYVDFINIMAYDLQGAWSQFTGFNSPLFPRAGDWRFHPKHCVEWVVQMWISKGAPPSKLVLGIAGYGQSYNLAPTSTAAPSIDPIQSDSETRPSKDPSDAVLESLALTRDLQTPRAGLEGPSTDAPEVTEVIPGIGSPANGPGKPGRLRHLNGQLSFPEICEFINQGGHVVWNQEQRVPFMTLGDLWVGYDNRRSVVEKVTWAISQNLGGVMFWSLDLDDFTGNYCGKGAYPLLTAISDTVTSLVSMRAEVDLEMAEVEREISDHNRVTTDGTQRSDNEAGSVTFDVDDDDDDDRKANGETVEKMGSGTGTTPALESNREVQRRSKSVTSRENLVSKERRQSTDRNGGHPPSSPNPHRRQRPPNASPVGRRPSGLRSRPSSSGPRGDGSARNPNGRPRAGRTNGRSGSVRRQQGRGGRRRHRYYHHDDDEDEDDDDDNDDDDDGDDDDDNDDDDNKARQGRNRNNDDEGKNDSDTAFDNGRTSTSERRGNDNGGRHAQDVLNGHRRQFRPGSRDPRRRFNPDDANPDVSNRDDDFDERNDLHLTSSEEGGDSEGDSRAGNTDDNNHDNYWWPSRDQRRRKDGIDIDRTANSEDVNIRRQPDATPKVTNGNEYDGEEAWGQDSEENSHRNQPQTSRPPHESSLSSPSPPSLSSSSSSSSPNEVQTIEELPSYAGNSDMVSDYLDNSVLDDSVNEYDYYIAFVNDFQPQLDTTLPPNDAFTYAQKQPGSHDDRNHKTNGNTHDNHLGIDSSSTRVSENGVGIRKSYHKESKQSSIPSSSRSYKFQSTSSKFSVLIFAALLFTKIYLVV